MDLWVVKTNEYLTKKGWVKETVCGGYESWMSPWNAVLTLPLTQANLVQKHIDTLTMQTPD